MAKLRHFAITVDDMEQTASFYENAFDLKRVRESDVAIMLSDGTMSLAIIHSGNANAEGRKGLHHIGFLVDEMEAGATQVEKSGGIHHGQIRGIGAGPQSERKYRGPEGITSTLRLSTTLAKSGAYPESDSLSRRPRFGAILRNYGTMTTLPCTRRCITSSRARGVSASVYCAVTAGFSLPSRIQAIISEMLV